MTQNQKTPGWSSVCNWRETMTDCGWNLRFPWQCKHCCFLGYDSKFPQLPVIIYVTTRCHNPHFTRYNKNCVYSLTIHALPWLRWLVLASHCWWPGFIWGQAIWNLWTKWHWGRLFSGYFGFLVSIIQPMCHADWLLYCWHHTMYQLTALFNNTPEHSQLAEVQQSITNVLHSTVHSYLLWTTPSSSTRVILVASCGESANACFCIFFNSPLTKYHISWTPFTILRLICSYCTFGSSRGSEKLRCKLQFHSSNEYKTQNTLKFLKRLCDPDFAGFVVFL